MQPRREQRVLYVAEANGDVDVPALVVGHRVSAVARPRVEIEQHLTECVRRRLVEQPVPALRQPSAAREFGHCDLVALAVDRNPETLGRGVQWVLVE